MKNFLKKIVKKVLKKHGISITMHSDFTDIEKKLISKVSNETMTNEERMVTLVRAVNYIIENNISGDFVECGVWKGGSSMLMAYAMLEKKSVDREIYMYDTYEGMPNATKNDFQYDGQDAQTLLDKNQDWCRSPYEEVKLNMESTGYNLNKIKFVKGMVEDTIPKTIPEKIALLRLDTDWYESTKHEMIHLFPKLQVGGVLIIDDYGWWEGAKKAIDEYVKENKIKLFLNRVDYSCRIAIKQ